MNMSAFGVEELGAAELAEVNGGEGFWTTVGDLAKVFVISFVAAFVIESAS